MQADESPLVFPKKADRARIDNYRHYDLLYFGDHYDAFGIAKKYGKENKEFPDAYKRLRYVVGNFAGLMSRVMADMLFGEQIAIDLKKDKSQAFIDALMEENELITQFYESALANSRRGDSCFKVRIGQRNPKVIDSPSTVIVEEFTPAIYFPELSEKSTRYTPDEDVLGITFRENGATYLRKEIHQPGYIFNEIYAYNPNEGKITGPALDPAKFGYKEEEETGVKRSLVFHIPNVRDGSGYFGTSDYKDLDSLMFALNNRISKTDNILDKHSDPILAVPPGVIDEDGKINKSALGMFEVDNETPGFNKPEYIVWNANLDAAEKELDRLVDFLFMFSEIAPASVGHDNSSGGKAESGRALKFKLLATIRKRNRKLRYYDQAIKDMLVTSQELATFHNVTIDGVAAGDIERPSIKWGDGVINDEVERVENVGSRIDQGTMSRADGIVELDGLTQKEAKAKVKEIDAESGPTLDPITNNLNGGGTGGADNSDSNNQNGNESPAGS